MMWIGPWGSSVWPGLACFLTVTPRQLPLLSLVVSMEYLRHIIELDDDTTPWHEQDKCASSRLHIS